MATNMPAAAAGPPMPPPGSPSYGTWGGDDRGPIFNGVVWAMTILATIAVALRTISRTAFGGNKLGLDDYITYLCLAVNFVTAITVSLAVTAGAGKHIYDVPPQNLPIVGPRILAANVMSLWAFSLPKFAIVAVIERLLPLRTGTRVLFWGLAIVNQAGIIVLTILFTATCQNCGNLEAQVIVGWIFSAMSPFLDILLAVYPIPFILKLNLSRRKRYAIAAALSMGCLASVFSIYKCTLLPSVAVAEEFDPTYGILPIVLFGMVEANILIVTASLPTIGPLLNWAGVRNPLTQPSTKNPSRNDTSGWPKNSKSYKLQNEELNTLVSDPRNNHSKFGSDPPKNGIYRSVEFSVTRV